MRVILDTNIIVSALISEHGGPAQLLNAWVDRAFELVTSTLQIEEIAAVTRRAPVRPLITPSQAGRFINDLRRFGTVLQNLPIVERSPDPNDNYLLAMAEASAANFLVSGDKRHILILREHGSTRIVAARDALQALGLVE